MDEAMCYGAQGGVRGLLSRAGGVGHQRGTGKGRTEEPPLDLERSLDELLSDDTGDEEKPVAEALVDDCPPPTTAESGECFVADGTVLPDGLCRPFSRGLRLDLPLKSMAAVEGSLSGEVELLSVET